MFSLTEFSSDDEFREQPWYSETRQFLKATIMPGSICMWALGPQRVIVTELLVSSAIVTERRSLSSPVVLILMLPICPTSTAAPMTSTVVYACKSFNTLIGLKDHASLAMHASSATSLNSVKSLKLRQ